jgi:DNA-binding response OmpR family regulator
MTKQQINILLFEKDESIGNVVCEFLRMNEYNATAHTSCESARRENEANPCAVCIISFSRESQEEGFKLAKAVKTLNRETFIIFMSANPSLKTLSSAYALEADDFIRKPFIPEELLLRIRAIMRRSEQLKSVEPQAYSIGRYRLNALKQTLSIGDSTVKITTKECDLLMYLCKHMNNLVCREDILKSVWRNDSYYNARSMDVYITKLRGLLKGDKFVGIINVHGKGYKLLVIDEE